MAVSTHGKWLPARCPITGIVVCCACAASDYAAALLSPAMNSRRRISALQRFAGKPIANRDALEPALMAAPGPVPVEPPFPGGVRKLG